MADGSRQRFERGGYKTSAADGRGKDIINEENRLSSRWLTQGNLSRQPNELTGSRRLLKASPLPTEHGQDGERHSCYEKAENKRRGPEHGGHADKARCDETPGELLLVHRGTVEPKVFRQKLDAFVLLMN